MIILSQLISLFSLGALLGLYPAAVELLIEQPIPPDTLITLRRPDCFLSCPDYLVTIAADGTVTFEGFKNVRMKGKVQARISRDKVQLLVNA